MRYFTVETTEKLASSDTEEVSGILHKKKYHVETHSLWAADESEAMRLAMRRHPAAHRARVVSADGQTVRKPRAA